VGDPIVEMTTVSPGRAGANCTPLQHDDTHARFGEVQGRRETRETSTDDSNIISPVSRVI
jgi:hypothetical protein